MLMRMFTIVMASALLTGGVLHAKSLPQMHTSEEVAHVRRLCVTENWAIEKREKAEAAAARWVSMSDDALWEFIPEAELPRALNVAFGEGCPVHGREVFKHGGHYPWIMSKDKPFKVTCPVGNETYPSNDYETFLKGGRKESLDTTQPYVDDGFGYVAPDGKRYWFVGTYLFWHRWRAEIMGGIGALTDAYLLTGEEQYAHKLGVWLGRLIEVYPAMDYSTQAYHNGKWPAEINGRIFDYVWENRTITAMARAYDALRNVLPEDKELVRFLGDRGISDLNAEFEREVLQFMACDVMEGRIRGNMYYQPTLATLAIVLHNDDASKGATTEQMIEWILHGGGEIESILYNGFDRDGAGGESAPGYSSSWNANFSLLADDLIRLGYDVTKNSRWRQLARFPYNLRVAGDFAPRIGDSGGTIHCSKGSKNLINTRILRFGYEHFDDPQCAQLLLEHGSFEPSLWGKSLDKADVARVAASAADQTDQRTRDLGGYGLAVFDTGEGAARRGATLYYGGPDAWHGHRDRLTISYHAYGMDFLTEMGYPSHWDAKGERFTRGMPSHYVAMIDQKGAENKKSGFLDFFAAGRRVRAIRARAETVYPNDAERYNRTFVMIDVGDDSFLLDLFQVKGGALHDYHFHGLPFGDFSTSGLTLKEVQKGGTLFGEDVAWGAGPQESKEEPPVPGKPRESSGYDFLRNVRRYTCDPVWSARWEGRDESRLTYYMPGFSEVIVCDGEPPKKEDYPDTMEFIVVRNPAHETHFPAAIVPSRGESFVRNITFAKGSDATRYHVETVASGTWTVDIGDGGMVRAECVRTDGSAYLFSANAQSVEFGFETLQLTQHGPFTIESVDYAENRVTLKEALMAPEKLVGEVVVIRGNGHSASYTVASAGERELCFKGTIMDGVIVADDVRDNVVTTSTRLSGYGTQVSSRPLPGRVLVSEDMKEAAVITTQEDGRFELGRSIVARDTNGDGRTQLYIADFVVGYAVHVSPWMELERGVDGEIDAVSNLPLDSR